VTDVRELLERQARRQKERVALSWPDKLRLVERVRESIKGLRSATKRESKDNRRGRIESNGPDLKPTVPRGEVDPSSVG